MEKKNSSNRPWKAEFGGIAKKICMSKARNFAASAPCDGWEHRTCQKGHYNLEQLKARTEQTEILYIFFGIHTANVVQLADRIEHRAPCESTAGGCMKRQHTHGKVLSQGELFLCHGELTKNPAETTGMRYKNINLMCWSWKRMGPVGCFGHIENIRRQSLQ